MEPQLPTRQQFLFHIFLFSIFLFSYFLSLYYDIYVASRAYLYLSYDNIFIYIISVSVSVKLPGGFLLAKIQQKTLRDQQALDL